MIRLLVRTSALILFFAVAIVAVRLVGSTQPRPALFSVLFTNSDGSPCEMPCMFGVRPGKMTVDKAISLLKGHPFVDYVRTEQWQSQDLPAAEGRVEGKNFDIGLVRNASALRLYSDVWPEDINGHWFAWLPIGGTLGDAINMLGYPDWVL